MSTENSPLLSNENDCNLPYGHTTATPETNRQATYVTVPPIGPYELPPPYTPSPHRVPIITCEVCGFIIDITGKWDLHVIICSSCNEATPIKSAPPGKKYVRCQCNCLSICNSSSQRIRCLACTRLINLIPVQTNISSLPGMCQVSCAYCQNLFMFKTLNLDWCPHCGKVSAIGQTYPVSLGYKYLIAGVITLILCIGFIIGTYSYSTDYIFLYIIYLGGFIVPIKLCSKSVYYFTMKTSTIVN